jgi:lambda repressor-like predicted transcriptional regulator
VEPIDIKYALEREGVNQTAIAAYLAVPRSTVYAVIYGRGRSKTVEMHVAHLIGKPLEQVWPKWYGPNAQRPKGRVPVSEVLARARARLAERESAKAA